MDVDDACDVRKCVAMHIKPSDTYESRYDVNYSSLKIPNLDISFH